MAGRHEAAVDAADPDRVMERYEKSEPRSDRARSGPWSDPWRRVSPSSVGGSATQWGREIALTSWRDEHQRGDLPDRENLCRCLSVRTDGPYGWNRMEQRVSQIPDSHQDLLESAVATLATI